jgi:hypothetical protein
MQVPRVSPRISLIEMAPRPAPRSGCPGRPALPCPCPAPALSCLSPQTEQLTGFPRVPVKRSRRRCFSLWPVLQQKHRKCFCSRTSCQTSQTEGQTKWINILDWVWFCKKKFQFWFQFWKSLWIQIQFLLSQTLFGSSSHSGEPAVLTRPTLERTSFDHYQTASG